MSAYFMPKLVFVEALQPYRLRTGWSTGEVLEVDLEPRLRRHPALAPLLDPVIFARVHLGEWGNSLEWLDEEFGADNVYAWAREQAGEVSHEMFDDWLRRNALSSAAAAEALGIEPSLIDAYRVARQPIPRAIWLACLGWEAIGPVRHYLPRKLPPGREPLIRSPS